MGVDLQGFPRKLDRMGRTFIVSESSRAPLKTLDRTSASLRTCRQVNPFWLKVSEKTVYLILKTEALHLATTAAFTAKILFTSHWQLFIFIKKKKCVQNESIVKFIYFHFAKSFTACRATLNPLKILMYLSHRQCFLLSRIIGQLTPKNYCILFIKKKSGSKYPKIILFNFEKGCTDPNVAFEAPCSCAHCCITSVHNGTLQPSSNQC